MTDSAHTLWLQTFSVLVIAGVGLMLHLRWHPLRGVFSDAWETLLSFSWLVPAMAALQLFSGPLQPWAVPDLTAAVHPVTLDAESWGRLFGHSIQGLAALTHGFFPPWPVALALPLGLSLLVCRVARFPYRYDSRRKSPLVLRLLIGSCVLAWGWVGLEVTGWIKPMPEWLETLRLLLRWLAEALMMAGLQVWMIRLVMGWEDPEEPDDQHDAWLALEHSLSRWQGVMMLAALDLLWLLAWRAVDREGQGIAMWVIIESSFLFATVPLVIAWVRAPWMQMCEAMMQIFLQAFLPMLGFFISAAVIFMLVNLAMVSMLSWVSESPQGTAGMRILIALVLATVRSWLFLTFVLTLLRHGLKTAALREQAN